MGTWFQPISHSVAEYGERVWARWWSLIPAGVGAVLGLIALAEQSSIKHGFVPTWLWLTLLLGGLTVAQFLAFHDVRIERDKALQDEAEKFNAYQYRFQMTGVLGQPTTFIDDPASPGKPGYRITLVFANGSTEVMEYEIESVTIVLGGYTSTMDIDNAIGIILPGQRANFICSSIYAPIDPVLSGEGQYTVKYGHPASVDRFVTHHIFKIGWDVYKSPTGQTQGYGVDWHTMGHITDEPWRLVPPSQAPGTTSDQTSTATEK